MSEQTLFVLDVVAQTGVSVLGLLATFLVAKKNRWGVVCGLVSQPFWFATTLINHQWGVFLLCFAYTASWTYGIYEWFFKKPPVEKTPSQ